MTQKKIEFSLPNIQTNTFLEYQITYKTINQMIPNHWSHHGSLMKLQSNKNRLDSLRKSSISVKVPKEQKLYHKFYNIKGDVDIEATKEYSVYRWIFENINTIHLEQSAQKKFSEIVPNYTISTMNDWSIFNNYFYDIFNKKIVVTDKLKKLSQRLTKGLENDQDKIKSIYKYMQENIKYIFANFGSGGYTPHFAEEINDNLYGDCKDQSILFITLLKAINIKAYAVLVNNYDYTNIDNTYIPTPDYFNHVIVYIPSQNSWVDNTGSKFIYPGISMGSIGQSSLIIQDKNFEFKKIIVSLNNETIITNDFEIKDNHLISSVTIDFFGIFSQMYKSRYQYYGKDFETKYKSVITQIYPKNKIENFQLLNMNSVDKNAVIKFTLKSNGVINLDDKINPILGYTGGIDSLVSSLTTFTLPTDVNKTKYGLNLGFTHNIKVISNCKAPMASSKPNLSQIAQTYDTKYIKTTFTQKKDSNNISIVTNYIIKEKGVKAEDYESYYKDVQNILLNSTWVVQYKYNETYKLESELEQKDDLTSQMKLVKVYLNSMNLDKAKEILDQYIKLNSNDIEVNYLYGVTLGFLGENIASQKYLKIADRLKEEASKK